MYLKYSVQQICLKHYIKHVFFNSLYYFTFISNEFITHDSNTMHLHNLYFQDTFIN